MIVHLQRLLDLSYDSDLCYDLYRIGNYDVLLELMVPLARTVLSIEMKGLSDELFDEYLSSSIVTLCENIRNRKYDDSTPDPDRFTNFFYTAVKRTLSSDYWSTKLFIPESGSECYTHRVRFITHQDIDNRIFLAQLPYEIYHLVESRIRFDGKEYEACLYVLERILQGKRVVAYKMKKQYGIQDYLFFIRYVQILIRSVLYEMKECQSRYRYASVA